MPTYLIKNTCIVNEGKQLYGDVLLKNNRIERIATNIQTTEAAIEIDGSNQYLLPGCIDDQVHFREPGLTHKANIYTEAKAAIAGGVTSFMEMPNTNPPVFTQALLEQKYEIGKQTALA
ncbi:MAG: amidohydrolase family protein, partial [Deinococcales bacterium]|nr:amidohydrolase family protein [Chitinophagaceae bacterium]